MSTLTPEQVCAKAFGNLCCTVDPKLFYRELLVILCKINAEIAEAAGEEVIEVVAEDCEKLANTCCHITEAKFQQSLIRLLCNISDNIGNIGGARPNLLNQVAGAYYIETEDPFNLVFNADLLVLPLGYGLITATSNLDNPPEGTAFEKAAYQLNDEMPIGSQLLLSNYIGADLDLFVPDYDDQGSPPSIYTINGSSYSLTIPAGSTALIVRTSATDYSVTILG